MANLVVHFEIHASEPQKLDRLLLRTPRLDVHPYGEAPYWSIDTGEGAIGNVAGTAGHGINGGLMRTTRTAAGGRGAGRWAATSSSASTTWTG